MRTNFSGYTTRRRRNITAAILSVIPGCGQLYKGHYIEGFGIMLMGAAVAIWLGIFASLIYAAEAAISLLGIPLESWVGILLVPILLGLLPPLLAWLWVVCEAFEEDDLRHSASHQPARANEN